MQWWCFQKIAPSHILLLESIASFSNIASSWFVKTWYANYVILHLPIHILWCMNIFCYCRKFHCCSVLLYCSRRYLFQLRELCLITQLTKTWKEAIKFINVKNDFCGGNDSTSQEDLHLQNTGDSKLLV